MSREISRPLYRKSCGKNAEGAEQAADRENKDRQRRHTGMQEQRREINGPAACPAAAEQECIGNSRHPAAYVMSAGAQTRRQVLRKIKREKALPSRLQEQRQVPDKGGMLTRRDPFPTEKPAGNFWAHLSPKLLPCP